MPASRQNKIRALRSAGFLPLEIAQMVSSTRTLGDGRKIRVKPLPLDVPYIKYMIRERARGYRLSKRQGMKPSEFRTMIEEEIYDNLDFYKPDGSIDFWQLLRREEERWKQTHPEYESPGNKSKKRKQTAQQFVSKYAKGLDNYARGRGKE